MGTGYATAGGGCAGGTSPEGLYPGFCNGSEEFIGAVYPDGFVPGGCVDVAFSIITSVRGNI